MLANAIRAEKGYSVHAVKREDGQAPKAESLGSVIAWEIGGGAPKPVTVTGSPDGEYLITDSDGRIRDQKGRSYRRMEEALKMGGEEGPKFKTQQEADQAVVSGPPNVIEGQAMRPTPTLPAGEVRVDSFNTVGEEDTQFSRTDEKKQAAGDVSQESEVEPEGEQADPDGSQRRDEKARGRGKGK